MTLHILDYLKGYVRIRITGAACDRFLNLCAFHGIQLWKILPCGGNAYEACIPSREVAALRAIRRKSRVSVRIIGKYGVPFILHRYRHRKFFLVGAGLGLFLMLWLSSHVWKIQIDGNLAVTDEVLFEYLEQEGIGYGIKKSSVDCRELAAKLRNQFPSFSWTAAELTGTQLSISVREGVFAADGEEEEEEGLPSGLVAAKEGVVVSIYVRSGLPLVQAGDTVTEGQELVTGRIPVYSDDGEITHYQDTAADADIVIRTVLPYSDRISRTQKQKRYTGRTKKQRSLEILGTSFAVPCSFSEFAACDITGQFQQLHLSESFYLPVCLKTYIAKEYEYEMISLTNEQLLSLLQTNLQLFTKNLEEKGVQIFENNVKIEWTEKSAVASGTLVIDEAAVKRSTSF